jgi:hypothetical protein
LLGNEAAREIIDQRLIDGCAIELAETIQR